MTSIVLHPTDRAKHFFENVEPGTVDVASVLIELIFH